MNDTQGGREILVVVSKAKGYIRSTSGMSMSGTVAPALSDIIRQLCDRSIERRITTGIVVLKA